LTVVLPRNLRAEVLGDVINCLPLDGALRSERPVLFDRAETALQETLPEDHHPVAIPDLKDLASQYFSD
jgi:hypothetical protein